MKLGSKAWLCAGLIASLAVGCSDSTDTLDPKIAKFVRAKQKQAHSLAAMTQTKLPTTVDRMYKAILADDFRSATNLYGKLEKLRDAGPTPFDIATDWITTQLKLNRNTGEPWGGLPWEPIRESYWMYRLSKAWSNNRLEKIVDEITGAIGTNSIYFGGTDVGRFAVTAAMSSRKASRSSFVLTQNQLCDGWYCSYIRSTLTNYVSLPSSDDLAAVFNRYLIDAERRRQAGKLYANEIVTKGTNGVPSVSGSGAYWELTGLIAREIFDRNLEREFYIEQYVPLRWMYPHLLPAGPIFKLSREPMERLPDSVVENDRLFWWKQCNELLGDWLGNKTYAEVCDFVRRIYLPGDLRDFKGDHHYLRERVSQEYYSKLRLGSADLYRWRCVEAHDAKEKQRMADEGHLAFKQAFALGPANSEVAISVADALASVKQYDEGVEVLRICIALNPDATQLPVAISRIQKLKEKETQ